MCSVESIAQPPPSSPLPAPPNPAEIEAKVQRAEVERQEQARIRSKWDVTVDVQMVAMEEVKALDLLPDLQSGEPAKVDAVWTKIQAMIKSKEAMLLAWPMVRTVDGTRSVAESILEQRYPTEFESPIPAVPGKGAAVPAPAPPAGAPAPVAPEKPHLVDNVDNVPTGFETRNVGATLEVEATVLDEGKRIYLDLVPQRVALLEMEKIESYFAHDTAKVNTPQPIFTTSKSTQSLIIPNGQRQLVGVHKLTKPANYLELHFVHAVATKSE
jgi:hypothetical protein